MAAFSIVKIYFDGVHDLLPPSLDRDVCPTQDSVHLDQAGIFQSNDEVVAQWQIPLQLHDHAQKDVYRQMFKKRDDIGFLC